MQLQLATLYVKMRSFYGLSLILANTVAIYAQLLLFGPGQSDFKLADKNSVSSIVVASNELVGVARAAQDLAWDFGRVIGVCIVSQSF